MRIDQYRKAGELFDKINEINQIITKVDNDKTDYSIGGTYIRDKFPELHDKIKKECTLYFEEKKKDLLNKLEEI